MQLEQVEQLALEVGAHRAVRRGAHDRPAATQVEALGLAPQPLALGVLEPPRHADPLAGGRVDHVAPGDRQVHREPRALRLQRILDDLHDDLLPGLQQRADVLRVLARAAAAALRLDAGQHDLIDVQEAVLVEADVDERRLQPDEDVVDDPLVDVADDRARAAPLEVELSDAVAAPGVGAHAAPSLRGPGGAGRLQQRDARLAAIDADQDLLFHG